MSTDRDWQTWGETDPYFGVLTFERFRTGSIDDNRDEFFATGERDVAAILDRYDRCFGPSPRGSVLDFGCGVGRLALAFARRFDSVVGLDIAEGMLAEARLNAERLDVGNVRFATSDDRLTGAPDRYDFVNSLIVLQHIPRARGLPIVARLLDRVRPGGGCMLHFAVQRNQTPLRRAAYVARHRMPYGNQLTNLVRGRPRRSPTMQMNEYPVTEVLRLFNDRGMGEVLVNVLDQDGVTTLSLIASRPASANGPG